MIILETPQAMRRWSMQQQCAGRSVGFVPTMGALHQGHISLMEASVRENDVTVLSIFVNPTQFGPDEDLDAYPRTWDFDKASAIEAGADAIYAPSSSAMYTGNFSTFVNVGQVSAGLCGGTRPIHFQGVATVCTKLFNAVLPTRAYFGQKDGQQCAVIKRLVRDMDMDLEICVEPIVRDPDGMAMSSRNKYLTPSDRERGLCLSRAVFKAHDLMQSGEVLAEVIINLVREEMKDVDIDYVSLVDFDTMEPVDRIDTKVMLAVAAQVGQARLLDNVTYEGAENANQPIQEQDSSSDHYASRLELRR